MVIWIFPNLTLNGGGLAPKAWHLVLEERGVGFKVML
jgi:hypothetical protein